MMMSIDQMAEHAKTFQKILQPMLKDAMVESWQLAIALSWAQSRQLKFLWFKEENGLVHNGLTVIDVFGDVIYSEIQGFEDEDEKLFMEALASHELMHDEKEVEYLTFDE